MSEKALVIGCGYVGEVLAKQLLLRETAVTGWVRNKESAICLEEWKVTPHVGDVSLVQDWKSLPQDFTAVIHCASSKRGGVDQYRSVYWEGAKRMIEQQPQAKLIFFLPHPFMVKILVKP